MPYRYLEDIATADVAFAAWGTTREELFAACADALTNVMVADLASIRRNEEIEVHLENGELDLLLFAFLNELVFYKDARQILLRVASLAITDAPGEFLLDARLAGERIDPDRHSLIVDVKAVTLHRFRVAETTQGWKAEVVLDI
jgi:SHS2 domain-containing protein